MLLVSYFNNKNRGWRAVVGGMMIILIGLKPAQDAFHVAKILTMTQL